jgi:hypothetical protein
LEHEYVETPRDDSVTMESVFIKSLREKRLSDMDSFPWPQGWGLRLDRFENRVMGIVAMDA